MTEDRSQSQRITHLRQAASAIGTATRWLWRDKPASHGLRRGRERVFLFQVIDVGAVGFGERRVFDKENILGVELSAAREVIGAGDHGVVDHQDFVVHEIVAPGWCVGR